MFYKVVRTQENTTAIIDVLETPPRYVKFQERNKILVMCEKDEAMGILSSGQSDAWHIEGLYEFPAGTNYPTVELIEIGQAEYEILKKSLEESKEIPQEQAPHVDPIGDATLALVKENKIAKMSKTCHELIEAGFDVVLEDNENHHFSLTTQDQLNLITLSSMVAAGEQQIPYHADGEICKFYSALDIQKILEYATAHKTWHVSYYNSLKPYIMGMTTIEEVAAVEYGIEIPMEHQSVVLAALNQEVS